MFLRRRFPVKWVGNKYVIKEMVNLEKGTTSRSDILV